LKKKSLKNILANGMLGDMVNIRDVWHHYQLLKKKSLKNILANGMLGDIGSI